MKDLCFHPQHISSLKKPKLPASMIVPGLVIFTVFAALVIASVANVEVITSASGRIIPSGKVKVIKASESGLVSKLYVEDGQKVKQGEVLFEIDSRSGQSELRQIENELSDVKSRYSLIEPVLELPVKALRGFTRNDVITWVSKQKTSSLLDQNWLIKRLSSIQDLLLQADREVKELKIQRRMVSAEVAKLKRLEPIRRKSYDSQRLLANQGYISKESFRQHELEYLESRATLNERQINIELLDARVASLQKKGPETYRQFQVEMADEFRALSQQKKGLKERKVGLGANLDKTQIISPISGVVEGIKITSQGIYVATGDELMSIVPKDDTPIAEIAIPSQEIGFLREGQTARIKVDAFPFTRYGSLSAKLIYLSRDASTTDDGASLFYTGHLELGKTSFSVKGEQQPVQTGMSIKGEIITNERRLIDFFISPIKETLSEALIER